MGEYEESKARIAKDVKERIDKMDSTAKVKPTINHVPKHTLYWGNYETRNFSFDAFGRTEQKCLEHLISGWIKHCQEFGVEDKYVHETIVTMKEEFYPIPIMDGVCYRDRDRNILEER